MRIEENQISGPLLQRTTSEPAAPVRGKRQENAVDQSAASEDLVALSDIVGRYRRELERADAAREYRVLLLAESFRRTEPTVNAADLSRALVRKGMKP